jgi:hypothetical protein
MISVGSGTCIFLEANQLQADKQANIDGTHDGLIFGHFPQTLFLQNRGLD